MTATKLGRFHTPEPPSAIRRLHFHQGAPLKPVDHEPGCAVLDQEDLLAQGIQCSRFIAGAGNPDALGSCTCNTLVEALSRLLTRQALIEHANQLLGLRLPSSHPILEDTRTLEMLAIGLYHRITDQTGSTASEWPPTDCGSSGPYLYQYALANRLIATERIAHGAQSICSLMQTDGLLVGLPWLQAWFEPDTAGFIDGDGSVAALQAAIDSGVAGGHEIYFAAVEKLTVHTLTGLVDPFKTVIRFRNHWGNWADNGDGRVHLSTIVALGNQVDLRQFTRA